jgi:hypothetical protein
LKPPPEPATAATPAALTIAPPTPPPSEPDQPSWSRRHWWVYPVLGAVIAGGAFAAYWETRPEPAQCNFGSIGCLPLGR